MEQANNPTPELFQEYDTAGKSKPASTTPALPCALGIGKEEAADLKVIEELKLMGNLLATAVQRYLDASHMLRSISSPHSLGSKKFTPVLQALNALDEQLVHLQSHRAKLDQAHAATLCHIFRLVTVSQLWNMIVREGLRSKHVLDALKRSAIYPNTLSEVCKSWHRLITGTPALWSYIDLVVSGSHKKMVYPRASLFVERATSTPLFIRIHEPCPASPDDNQQLVRWLSPVAGQLYSLDFSNAHRTTRVAHSVLGCWLKHGAPGTFKEITVWDITRTPTASPFIEPNLGGAPAEWKLDVSAQRLEEFFEPITRLHLRYVFPHWDSRAYSGLTHLNLWGDSITEVQLRRILCNSPPLETLYLALQVTDTEPRTASCVPVHLPCLEALSLNALGASQVSSILRLIAPGPRPLKPAFLLAGNRQDGDFTEMSEIRAFSRRSIITTLYLGSPSNNNNIQSGWLFRTLKIFPHLRRLGLEYYRYLGELPLPEPEGNEVSSECPELRESCMFGCALDLDGFKRLIRTHFVQVLRTCRCRVFSGATELDLPEGELQGALSGSVLDVKCYESNENDCPDPYLNWDFVDGL